MSRRHAILALRQSAPVILPSLLKCDFGNLEREVRLLERAGVTALHLDVMDGQFVPNLTYGMPVVAGLRRLTQLPLDVHLMVQDPLRFVDAFYEAGADAITVHGEACDDPKPALDRIRELGAAVGLAVNPGTPLEGILDYLPLCDLILIMSVEAGFGGQAFDSRAVERLRRVRAAREDVVLEVDGGITAETIARCAEAGADLFVVGSAIFDRANYAEAVQELQMRARTSPGRK